MITETIKSEYGPDYTYQRPPTLKDCLDVIDRFNQTRDRDRAEGEIVVSLDDNSPSEPAGHLFEAYKLAAKHIEAMMQPPLEVQAEKPQERS